MRLRMPLWPFAEPPNFGDSVIGLCSRESCKTISEEAAREVFRRVVETGGPERFMGASLRFEVRYVSGNAGDAHTCLV
jgi:hypothetical protein